MAGGRFLHRLKPAEQGEGGTVDITGSVELVAGVGGIGTDVEGYTTGRQSEAGAGEGDSTRLIEETDLDEELLAVKREEGEDGEGSRGGRVGTVAGVYAERTVRGGGGECAGVHCGQTGRGEGDGESGGVHYGHLVRGGGDGESGGVHYGHLVRGGGGGDQQQQPRRDPAAAARRDDLTATATTVSRRPRFLRRVAATLAPAVNNNVIASILGIVVGVTPPLRAAMFEPGGALFVLVDAADIISGAAIPQVIIILGASLAHGPEHALCDRRTALSIAAVRLAAMPLLNVGIFLGLRATLPAAAVPSSPAFWLVFLVEGAMPTANNMMLQVQMFGSPAAAGGIGACLFWQYMLAPVSPYTPKP